jgi:hypothetical protein
VLYETVRTMYGHCGDSREGFEMECTEGDQGATDGAH